MQRLGQARSLVLWLVWFALVVVWLLTLRDRALAGDPWPTVLAAVAVGLLVILYFAEGIELAATDLLDKHPEQLRNPGVRAALELIQQNPGFFFAQRQVFVVVIVSYVSLSTAYPYLVVPALGRITDHNALFWFSLTFTTFTVLWFCQVTPKRLAVLNSELFLKQSKFVLQLIRLVGLLGLPNPTDQLVWLFQKYTAYGRPRYLLPSRKAHYSLAAHLYGLAADRVETRIVVQPDGSSVVRKRFLLLFTHGEHREIRDHLDTESAISALTVSLRGLHLLPAPEQLEVISGPLDALFTAGQPAPGADGDRIAAWNAVVRTTIEPRPDRQPGARATWTIAGPSLPESFWAQLPAVPDSRYPLAALLYDVEATLAAPDESAPAGPRQWTETITWPCRLYTLAVECADPEPRVAAIQGYAVTMAASGSELGQDLVPAASGEGGSPAVLALEYPLHGATYQVQWRLVPAGAESTAGRERNREEAR